MLETIALVLIVLWLLGLVSSYTMGGFIHILLVLAIVITAAEVHYRHRRDAGTGRTQMSLRRLHATTLLLLLAAAPVPDSLPAVACDPAANRFCTSQSSSRRSTYEY